MLAALPRIEIRGYHIGHAYGIFKKGEQKCQRHSPGLKSEITISVMPNGILKGTGAEVPAARIIL